MTEVMLFTGIGLALLGGFVVIYNIDDSDHDRYARWDCYGGVVLMLIGIVIAAIRGLRFP